MTEAERAELGSQQNKSLLRSGEPRSKTEKLDQVRLHMRRLNTIALMWRPVRRHAERIASEFAIDGRLLQDHIQRATKQPLDFASPIGWTVSDYLRDFAQRLLLVADPVLPSGRRELLVCPECADLGCGCVSVEITIGDAQVAWNAIGIENDHDPDSLSLLSLRAFVFDRSEYEGMLRGYAAGATEWKR